MHEDILRKEKKERDKVKVYYAQSISTIGEFNYSIEVANKIKKLGYDVYAPALNNKINDKSNNPTPKDIYNEDIKEIMKSDILVINLTGGKEDGTLTELGFVAGLNESTHPIEIIAFTSNKRLEQPQFHKGIPSASANHLALGMIEKFGKFVGNEDEMIGTLKLKIDGYLEKSYKIKNRIKIIPKSR